MFVRRGVAVFLAVVVGAAIVIGLTRAQNPQPSGVNGGLQEDFKKAKDGLLPEGWIGSANIGVSKREGSAWLRTTKEGWQRAYSPSLSVPGDFELECQHTLPAGYMMRLVLESEKTRDIVVTVNRHTGHVSLTGAKDQELPAAQSEVSRLVLKRKGTVYTLSIDGKDVIEHRVGADDVERFERLAIDLQDTTTYIHEVILRPQPAAASAGGVAKKVFFTDFFQAKTNNLPADWTGPPALGVKKDGTLGWLRSSKDGENDGDFTAKSALPKLSGDFLLDCHLLLPQSKVVTLKLLDADGEPLTITLNQHTGRAQLEKADQELPFSFVIRRLALQRIGTAYTLAIDGVEVISHRLENAATFHGIELVVNDTETLIYDVCIKQFAKAPE